MSTWTKFAEAEPVGPGPWLVRQHRGSLPQVAIRAGDLPGYRVSFKPLEYPPDRMRGHYYGIEMLSQWSWAEIPE